MVCSRVGGDPNGAFRHGESSFHPDKRWARRGDVSGRSQREPWTGHRHDVDDPRAYTVGLGTRYQAATRPTWRSRGAWLSETPRQAGTDTLAPGVCEGGGPLGRSRSGHAAEGDAGRRGGTGREVYPRRRAWRDPTRYFTESRPLSPHPPSGTCAMPKRSPSPIATTRTAGSRRTERS